MTLSRSARDLESIFITKSNTYASVKLEVSDAIRKKFGYTKGNVCGLRISPKYDWRICIYWREDGKFIRRRIGKLNDVLAKINL
jgi:hypothetical protein